MTRGNRTHYREYTKTSTEIRTLDLLKILFHSKLQWENTNSKKKERGKKLLLYAPLIAQSPQIEEEIALRF